MKSFVHLFTEKYEPHYADYSNVHELIHKKRG